MLLGVSTAALTLVSTAVHAQSAPPGGEVEEVVVTGTSIRGVAPTGSNLIGVTRDTITQAGATNSAEVLATVPQLANFGSNLQTGAPRTSGFIPNIHGLGVDATLTILNGHRYAPTGAEAIFTDPQVVPSIALQRVEVVADGASSIYGSDAMAGVVNFIYRKPFSGVEIALEKRWSESGRNQIGVIAGHDWGSGGAYIALQYADRDSARNDEFSFIRADNRDRGGRDQRSTSCATPNVRAGTVTYSYPNFTTTANRCEPSGAIEFIPNDKRKNLLIYGHQEISDRVNMTVEINASDYERWANLAPNPITVVVPRTNPYFRAPPGFTGNEVTVVRTTEGLFPIPVSAGRARTGGVTTGFNIDFGGDWKGDLMLHASMSRNLAQNSGGGTFFDIQQANILARNTTLATAFNPFGNAADNNPAVLAQIDPAGGYYNRNHVKNFLKEVTGKVDGPLFSMPGGEVRAAAGFGFREERTDQLQSTGTPTMKPPQQFIAQDVDLSRSSQSLFAELFVPLVGAGNAMPGIQALNLSLSGRFDNYERLGGTTNPKIGVVWKPIDDLSIRGSWGTSYQAPNLGRSTAPFGIPMTGVSRPPYGTINEYNVGGDNPNLESQTAKTYSVGFDYQPHYVSGLRLGLTFWSVRINNLLYQASANDRYNVAPFNQSLILNPTAAQLAAVMLIAPPISFVPDRIDAIAYNVVQNIGIRDVSGLDLDAGYSATTDFGRFDFTSGWVYLTRYRQQVLATSPFSTLLNQDARWKGRSAVNWSHGEFSVNFAANYIGKHRNITIVPYQQLKATTLYDLGAKWEPKFVEGLEIQLLALNVLDRKPQYADTTTGYDGQPLGRQMQLAIRKKF